MIHIPRRRFLQLAGSAAGAFALPGLRAQESSGTVSFFLIGDTHYLADRENSKQLDPVSRDLNSRLIDVLNKLPGTDLPEEIGGGKVPEPRGLIHAGDLIDTGDKPAQKIAQETEYAAWLADYGLAAGEGKLRHQVFEVYGNHDAPQGQGLVLDGLVERNTRRPGAKNVSRHGAHFSWDWGPVHCVALGIVVGPESGGALPRRFAPLASLEFLIDDLALNVGTSGRPVVLVHHVDVARYSHDAAVETPPARLEWEPSDVHAYYGALAKYNVAAILHGHTHTRNLFLWNGTSDTKAAGGIPTLNTDNASHFKFEEQAFLSIEIDSKETRVREYATKDSWQTGAWTPQVWRFPLRHA